MKSYLAPKLVVLWKIKIYLEEKVRAGAEDMPGAQAGWLH
jgi:hypothetical protein